MNLRQGREEGSHPAPVDRPALRVAFLRAILGEGSDSPAQTSRPQPLSALYGHHPYLPLPRLPSTYSLQTTHPQIQFKIFSLQSLSRAIRVILSSPIFLFSSIFSLVFSLYSSSSSFYRSLFSIIHGSQLVSSDLNP